METLLFALNAILPIVILIFLGYFIKRSGFLEEGWFKKGNKLLFRVILPCLLFVNVYNIESFSAINWSVVIYSEVIAVILASSGFLLAKFVIRDPKQKGVIMQCVFRSNFAIIGLPLAESLGGAEGVGIAAVLSAFAIPSFNIMAVIALTVFTSEEEGKKPDIKDILTKIAKNPLIWGVLCGLAMLGIRSCIPTGADGLPVFTIKNNLPFLFTAVNNIAKTCSPLSLIILGGLFDFSAIKGMARQIVIGTVSRIVAAPLFALGAAVLLSKYTPVLNFDASVYPALIALFASPVAVSSATMAQEMDGNDGALAGQLVVWTSVFSILTLFLFIFILRSIGLL